GAQHPPQEGCTTGDHRQVEQADKEEVDETVELGGGLILDTSALGEVLVLVADPPADPEVRHLTGCLSSQEKQEAAGHECKVAIVGVDEGSLKGGQLRDVLRLLLSRLAD
ncbi:hypothetical protein Vretifemale_14674, partial [Volvox reticuliferus]